MPVILGKVALPGIANHVSSPSRSSAYKPAMLLIGPSDERSVTRYVAIVVTRLCLMTAASGGICTYFAGRVFKSAKTPKTAATLARSLE